MDLKKEIHSTIEKSAAGKRFKNINKKKLQALFENAHVDIPEHVLHFPNLEMIKAAGANKQLQKFNPVQVAVSAIFKRKLVFVPLVAVIIMAAIYIINVINPTETVNGKILALNGPVSIHRNTTTVDAGINMIINNNDRIITGNTGAAVISIEDNLVLGINSGSTVSLTTSIEDGSKYFRFFLQQGRVHLYVRKILKDDTVSVRTNNSAAFVRGTLFSVNLDKHNTARYEVYEGKIKVKTCIDKTKYDIKDTIFQQLDKHFETYSRVVPENHVCLVKDNASVYRNINSKNIDKRIKAVSVPVVTDVANNRFRFAARTEKFMLGLSGSDAPLDIGVLQISVVPESAKIVIDGRRVVQNRSRVFLKKGEHRIEVWENGYRKKAVKYNLQKNTDSLLVDLGTPDKDYYKIVPSKISFSYVQYVNKHQLLLMMNKNGIIAATDLKKIQWRINLGERIFLNASNDSDLLFVNSESGKLYVIDIKSGLVKWNRILFGTVDKNQEVLYDKDSIYFLTSKRLLYKITKQGRLQWRNRLGFTANIKPFVTSRSLILSGNRELYRFDKGNGTMILQYAVGTKIVSMTGDRSNVYIASEDGKIGCFDLNRGDFIWSYSLHNKSDAKSMILTPDKNAIYGVNRQGYVLKLSKKGEQIWDHRDQQSSFIAPVVDRKNVYVADKNALFVLNKNNGDVIWSLVIPRLYNDNIATSDCCMFFITREKGLVVLKK